MDLDATVTASIRMHDNKLELSKVASIELPNIKIVKEHPDGDSQPQDCSWKVFFDVVEQNALRFAPYSKALFLLPCVCKDNIPFKRLALAAKQADVIDKLMERLSKHFPVEVELEDDNEGPLSCNPCYSFALTTDSDVVNNFVPTEGEIENLVFFVFKYWTLVKVPSRWRHCVFHGDKTIYSTDALLLVSEQVLKASETPYLDYYSVPSYRIALEKWITAKQGNIDPQNVFTSRKTLEIMGIVERDDEAIVLKQRR